VTAELPPVIDGQFLSRSHLWLGAFTGQSATVFPNRCRGLCQSVSFTS